MDDLIDFFKFLCFMLLFGGGTLGLLGGVFFAVDYYVEKNECYRYADLTHSAVYYSWSTPCYVLVEGRYITLGAATRNNSDVTVHQK